MTDANQIWRAREDVQVLAEDLLKVPATPIISEQGIRTNVSVGVQYLESWLRGSGCVPINNLMEDAATAEISRAQLWQWVRHGVVSVERVMTIMQEELDRICQTIGQARFAAGRFEEARRLFELMTRAPNCPEFLTSIAYEML